MTSLLLRPSSACRWACFLAIVLLLGGCASRGPRPAALVADATLSEQRANEMVNAWAQRLIQYVDSNGGDPAVLTRLPALRATGTLRPTRITFGVLDIEANVPE